LALSTASISLGKMTEHLTAIKAESRPGIRLVHHACGPAMLVGIDGGLICANTAARPLAKAWDARDAELRGLILSAAAAGGPINGQVAVVSQGDASGRQAFEIAAVPISEAEILVTARDASFEDNLTRALLRSRDLYKDLMACSADFGWETDDQGRFSYVSPSGALGYTASELNGAIAAEILQVKGDGAEMAFCARIPQENREVEGCDAEGRRIRLSISSRPTKDAVGIWSGARGIARDVTGEREREAALRIDQARNALLARIVLSIRSEAKTTEIVDIAVRSAADALRAEAAWALQESNMSAGEQTEMASPAGNEALENLARNALQRPDGRDESETDIDAYVEIGFQATDCLLAVAGSRTATRCAIVFARETDSEPWRAHEVELVHGIADHLAVALKQATMLANLERLSRTDELSGLLNRRALFEDISKRIGHQRRSGRPGCFLFIDLDHFKTVNDSLGHTAGDAVIRDLGRLLCTHIRVGDLAGRIGGDEFALWLEETQVDGAKAKAEQLMAECPRLRETAGDIDVPLSMSIGIAASDPDPPRSPQALADAADQALYAAKRQGRSQIVVADFTKKGAA